MGKKKRTLYIQPMIWQYNNWNINSLVNPPPPRQKKKNTKQKLLQKNSFNNNTVAIVMNAILIYGLFPVLSLPFHHASGS